MNNLQNKIKRVNKKMNVKKIIVLLLLSLSLMSCKNDMSDLDQYFAELKSIPPKPIDPLPEINSPEIFKYESDGLRDPFSNDLQITTELEKNIENIVEGEGPDLNRRKEVLENYPLDGLYMVGTYEQDGNYWGLIEDPESVIHRVLVGEYMGQNFGKIVAISEDQIDVSEWVSDGLGGWNKRESSIALRENE